MPWKCPKNCHEENPEDFRVTKMESRTDHINHFYAADDKELNEDLCQPKVYVGDDAEWGPEECEICESEVYWED